MRRLENRNDSKHRDTRTLTVVQICDDSPFTYYNINNTEHKSASFNAERRGERELPNLPPFPRHLQVIVRRHTLTLTLHVVVGIRTVAIIVRVVRRGVVFEEM